MDALENYYSGDAAWGKFAEMFDELNGDINVIELAQVLNNQIDLAAVILRKGGGWIQELDKCKNSGAGKH